MESPSTPEYGYYSDRSPNYHYSFNPSHTTGSPPNVAQYVGQISPGRADCEVEPSSNGTTVEIKVINPDKTSDKQFTLRNVDCKSMDLNKNQLGQNLVLTFDVG